MNVPTSSSISMKKRPSYYLDEKQINNLYKHVRKKMKRSERLERMRKFLKDKAPLFVSAVIALALLLIISIIKA